MSVQQSIPELHSLNYSLAKQKFSFSKAPRFPIKKNSVCKNTFYQIPVCKSQRTTTFGIGNKIKIQSKIEAPPPNRYKIEGQFESSEFMGKKKGFSFGYGRDDVIGGPLDQSKTKKLIPGPGQYPITSRLQKRASSIRSRLPDLSLNYLKHIPGPGTYNTPSFINQKGIYVLSKLQNSLARSFSPPVETNIRTKKELPGPGSYDSNVQINALGKYFYSKFHNSKVRSFEKSPRPDICKKELKNIPGPGSYNKFSQFG